MGQCSSQERRPISFGERSTFTFYQRKPIRNVNIFEIRFSFEQNLSTRSSQTSEVQHKSSQHNVYEIKIKKYQEKIETFLGDIASEIQNAFRVVQANQLNKIIFVEPFGESQKNLTLIFNQVIRMLFFFDHQLKFPSVNKIYANWLSVNCREIMAKVVQEMTILK